MGESVCRREARGRHEHVGRGEAAEAAVVGYDRPYVLSQANGAISIARLLENDGANSLQMAVASAASQA